MSHLGGPLSTALPYRQEIATEHGAQSTGGVGGQLEGRSHCASPVQSVNGPTSGRAASNAQLLSPGAQAGAASELDASSFPASGGDPSKGPLAPSEPQAPLHALAVATAATRDARPIPRLLRRETIRATSEHGTPSPARGSVNLDGTRPSWCRTSWTGRTSGHPDILPRPRASDPLQGLGGLLVVRLELVIVLATGGDCRQMVADERSLRVRGLVASRSHFGCCMQHR